MTELVANLIIVGLVTGILLLWVGCSKWCIKRLFEMKEMKGTIFIKVMYFSLLTPLSIFAVVVMFPIALLIQTILFAFDKVRENYKKYIK